MIKKQLLLLNKNLQNEMSECGIMVQGESVIQREVFKSRRLCEVQTGGLLLVYFDKYRQAKY